MHGRMARWRVAARCRRQLEGADRWHWVGEADRWVLPAGAGVGRVAFGLAIWLSVWPRPNAVGAVGEQAGQLAGPGAARWPAVQHSHADCSTAGGDAHGGAAVVELGCRHGLGQGVGDHVVSLDVGEGNVVPRARGQNGR